jgi:hypothetical protein
MSVKRQGYYAMSHLFIFFFFFLGIANLPMKPGAWLWIGAK